MASNTRSKSALKNIKAQAYTKSTISDKDSVMETYGSDSSSKQTSSSKRLKPTVGECNSAMDIDNSIPQHTLFSEPDLTSCDSPQGDIPKSMEIE